MQDEQEPDKISATPPPEGDKKALRPAAVRALQEAEARRARYLAAEAARPREVGGRQGKEPVRYGDWEVKGIASDF